MFSKEENRIEEPIHIVEQYDLTLIDQSLLPSDLQDYLANTTDNVTRIAQAADEISQRTGVLVTRWLIYVDAGLVPSKTFEGTVTAPGLLPTVLL